MRSPLGIKGASDIFFFNNNIWSNPSGTMGQVKSEKNTDFSDVLPYQLENFTLDNNLIYNGNEPLLSSFFDKVNPDDDRNMIHSNPYFPDTSTLITPLWLKSENVFSDGSFTIRSAFIRLVLSYGIPENKIKIQQSINNSYIPVNDIMGEKRIIPHSIGAFSVN